MPGRGLLWVPLRSSREPALRERIEVDVVEGRDDDVGPGGAQQLGVVGSRHGERRHAARASGLDPGDGVLDDEAGPRGEAELVTGGREDLRIRVPRAKSRPEISTSKTSRSVRPSRRLIRRSISPAFFDEEAAAMRSPRSERASTKLLDLARRFTGR
jgi:hypothetical protein